MQIIEESKDIPIDVNDEEEKDDLGFFVPIGCGRMLCSEIPSPLSGKAVEMEHYMFDALWNFGNKKIPALNSHAPLNEFIQ